MRQLCPSQASCCALRTDTDPEGLTAVNAGGWRPRVTADMPREVFFDVCWLLRMRLGSMLFNSFFWGPLACQQIGVDPPEWQRHGSERGGLAARARKWAREVNWRLTSSDLAGS